jgi:hypothetical protein
MTMIRNDEELAVQQELLGMMEGIVQRWREKLLPHHPENFALYAEGAIEQADILRAEIDAYLAQKNARLPGDAASISAAPSHRAPT